MSIIIYPFVSVFFFGVIKIQKSVRRRRYIKGSRINKFLLGDDSKLLNDDDSFLEKGIIDSTGVLELVSFIEDKFKIKVEDEELIQDNLDSLNKITFYIKKKTEYVSP